MAKRSIWLMLLMALIWGASFPVSKVAVDIIGPYAFRMAGSIVSCCVMFILFKKEILGSVKSISFNEIIKLTIIAVPNIFVVPMLNSVALYYTSVTNATILVYTMPCFTSIILMGIARRINFLSMASLALCFTGIVFTLKEVNIGIGEVVIIFSAISWAIGAVVSQKVITLVPFKAKLFWQILISTILVSLCYPFLQSGSLLQPIINVFGNTQVLFSVLYLGVIGNALVYYIWFYLIQHESAESTSYATLLSPIISVIIASLFMNEVLTVKQTLGFVLILSSAILVNVLRPYLKNNR